jgi:hypothetical protein
MDPVSLIGGGLSLLGGLFGGSSAKSAAQTQANAQLEAARIAADAAKFRPVGVTTRFGSSNFTVDPNTGYVTQAGYTVDPTVAMMRDTLLSQAAGGGLQTAQQATQAQQGLFNLGQQYLAQSPEAAAQDWMSKQQALLQPSRDVQYGRMQQGLFNTGRGGLAVAQGGNLAAANPEAAAYYNALAQHAAQAMQAGQAQTEFGAGLFNKGISLGTTAYDPLKSAFGTSQAMEEAAQQALNMGAELGGRVTETSANAGRLLAGGMTNAAATMAPSNAYSPWGTGLTALGNNQQLLSGLSNAWNSPYSANLGTAFSYGTNPFSQQSSMLAAQDAWF